MEEVLGDSDGHSEALCHPKHISPEGGQVGQGSIYNITRPLGRVTVPRGPDHDHDLDHSASLFYKRQFPA